jgi:hypothetical protein
MCPDPTRTITTRYLVNSFKEKNQLPICTVCNGKDVVFMHPYSEEKLCGRCFCESTENKIRVTIFKYDVLEPDDKIMVAAFIENA